MLCCVLLLKSFVLSAFLRVTLYLILIYLFHCIQCDRKDINAIEMAGTYQRNKMIKI